MKPKKVNVKIQLIELNKLPIDFLKYNCDILKSEFNTELNLFFWYNEKIHKISKTMNEYIINLFGVEQIYEYHPNHLYKRFLFDISYSDSDNQFTDSLSKIERNAKFFIFYNNDDTFINAVIDLISFIKASENKKIKVSNNISNKV